MRRLRHQAVDCCLGRRDARGLGRVARRLDLDALVVDRAARRGAYTEAALSPRSRRALTTASAWPGSPLVLLPPFRWVIAEVDLITELSAVPRPGRPISLAPRVAVAPGLAQAEAARHFAPPRCLRLRVAGLQAGLQGVVLGRHIGGSSWPATVLSRTPVHTASQASRPAKTGLILGHPLRRC